MPRKKIRKVFTGTELAKAQMELIEKKYGILPDEVNEEGYYYDGSAVLRAVKKEAKKKLKQKLK